VETSFAVEERREKLAHQGERPSSNGKSLFLPNVSGMVTGFSTPKTT